MENEIDLFGYLVNATAMLVLVCFVLAILHKISSIFLAIFSYPVYLSLYYFEIFSTKVGNNEKQFFRLNIPTTHNSKYFMNLFAAISAIGLLPNAYTFYMALDLSPENQANSIFGLIFGSSNFQIWHNGIALISLTAVLIISYFSEPDKRHPFEKIDLLTIPSLWKKTLKI